MMLSEPPQTRLREAIAEKHRSGLAGGATVRALGAGPGWRVLEVLCTAGDTDRAFEEEHENVSLSLVMEGSFQYRADHGRALMTPGSILLGNAGGCFRCGHKHGEGDLCLSFQFDLELFGEIGRELGVEFKAFVTPRLAADRALTHHFVLGTEPTVLEAASLRLAAHVLSLVSGAGAPAAISTRDLARVSDVVRYLDENFSAPVSIEDQAMLAGLSRFHFLRTFRRAVGATPHQYLLRRRLRQAAECLATTADPVTQICFDAGFGDLSNFNRTFRSEFKATPREFRRRWAGKSIWPPQI
jgi:AraC family transcriptional regulator